MWGDAERAIQLDTSDPLATVLLQVTGPAHIPWQDPRWQELFHGYNVWVHLELLDDNDKHNSCVAQACASLLQHAPRTSNLAALALHTTRMLKDVLPLSTTNNKETNGSNQITADDDGPAAKTKGESNSSVSVNVGAVEQFSNRIALVGKARTVAGALNLLRVLCHAVIVEAATRRQHQTEDDDDKENQEYLDNVFTYMSRENSRQMDTASDLVSALSQFLVSVDLAPSVPELYDTTTLCLELLLVLFSTQVYQPMFSSFQQQQQRDSESRNYSNFFWDKFLQKARSHSSNSHAWTPQSLVLTCLKWQMARPIAPEKSIAYYVAQLAKSVVQAKGERLCADGMYENHQIVMATAPQGGSENKQNENKNGSKSSHSLASSASSSSSSSKILFDASRGLLQFGGQIILLPFRLVSLAFGLWGTKEKGFDKALKHHYQSHVLHSNGSSTNSIIDKTTFAQKSEKQHQYLTKDALWLSDSIVADLSTCLLLLLVNNDRADPISNPFRQELESLTDNRWEKDGSAFPDLPALGGANRKEGEDGRSRFGVEREKGPITETSLVSVSKGESGVSSQGSTTTAMTSVNFEALFDSFRHVTHSELGALLLYTTLLASQSFSEAVAVRSDLDTLIVPLLRTLYFASSSRHFVGSDQNTSSNKLSIQNCPFRSPSQLYVIIILLLLFSQDSSFGSDAFRRIRIPVVSFYKERNLKEISLGSLLVLSLLRNLTFNLNRLRDPFLLSNCCAILMNLSASIVDLHDYAAMRLVSVTVSTMKRYSSLCKETSLKDRRQDPVLTSMYGEVSRTLLRVLRQCLRPKTVEANLHLIYALVYHQTDFKRATGVEGSPFRRGEILLIENVTKAGATVIEQNGARAAAKALKVLKDNFQAVREAASTSTEIGNGVKNQPKVEDNKETEEFTFTYEEEQDPEVFFVPYLWEVIVCSVTAGMIGWRKESILVFPLLDGTEDGPGSSTAADSPDHSDLPDVVAQGFATDVSDIV